MTKNTKIEFKPARISPSRLFYVLAFLGITAVGKAQGIITLNMNQGGKDRFFEASKLIAPVFKVEGDYIESYEGFGIKPSGPLSKYRITLPRLDNAIDTGYTYLYSQVTPSNSKGYTAVLIANYSRRAIPAIIYVDHNNNFDFTDDGEPDTFHLANHYIDIQLINPETPERKVIFRLSRFPFTKDLTFKRMADELFNEHSGTKTFVGTSLSFREQRFNLRFSDCVVGEDSFQLALQDVNNNGLYNEPGMDRILINTWGSEIIGTDFEFEIGLKKKTHFERNYKSFQVLSIDEFGRSIQFTPTPDVIAQRQLTEGKKIPKIRFIDANGKSRKISKFRRKTFYVYFWNKQQLGFEEDTSTLRIIHEKYGQRIHIIALNYGDNPKSLASYVEVNKVEYLCGVATKAIAGKFKIEKIPHGLLVKRRLRLHSNNLNPSDLLKLLDEGEF